MKRAFLIIVCLMQLLTVNGQTKKTGKPLSAEEKAYRREQMILNDACEMSRLYVKEQLNYPKYIKFSEIYDWGDRPENNAYCIYSYFITKGALNENIRQYYYCWLTLVDLKQGKWELLKMEFSYRPFVN